MDEGSSLKDDVQILKDMYPELELNIKLEKLVEKTSTIVYGHLPFRISLRDDVVIKNDEDSLKLSKLTRDMLILSIDPTKYPDLRRGITLTIQSQWMSEDDHVKIITGIHNEFDNLTDPASDLYDPYTPVLMLIFGYLTDDVGDILFPNNERDCNQEEYKAFEKVHEMANKEELTKKNYYCSICMDTKKGDKIIELPCGKHHLCLDCTKSYFSSMVEERNIVNVRCPECEYEELNLDNFKGYKEVKNALFTPFIPFHFFEDTLGEEFCKKYEKLFHADAASKLSKYSPFACITCRRCDSWCVKDDLDDPMIHCKNCDFTFCFDCLHSWHGYNNKCSKKISVPKEIIVEYLDEEKMLSDERKRELEVKYGRKVLRLEVDEYLADRMLDLAIEEEDSNLQRCPHCRVVVQRSDGCNKMRCSVCSASFCFICGSVLDIEDPYEHFREPYSTCYGLLFKGMEGAD